MKHLKYIVIILCIITLCSVIVYLFWPISSKASKENFTMSPDLINALDIGKCSSLMSSTLPTLTQVTADSYINTGRLKAWKHNPSKSQQPSSSDNAKYCYFNNDFSNNEKDYFMENKKCNKNDIAFTNIPFIDDVFPDSSGQNTTTTTPQKCVLKIDSTKVTDDSLVQFWSSVQGEDECIQMNQYLIDLNQFLVDKYAELQALKDGLQIAISSQNATIATQDQNITTNNTTINTLKGIYANSNVVLTDLDSQISQLTTHIYDYNHMCNNMTTYVSQELDMCISLSNTMVENTTPLVANLTQLHQNQAALQIRYDGLDRNIASNDYALASLHATYNSKYADYISLNKIYSICQASNSACDNNLAHCQTDLANDTIYYNNQVVALDTCSGTLATCQNDLSLCQAMSNSLEQSITHYLGLTSTCVNNKASCILNDAVVQTKIQGLNQEYAFVQQYYNFNDCSAFQAEVTTLSAQEADLLARCQHIQTQSDAAQTNMQQAIQSTQNTLNNSLATCSSTVSSARKTIEDNLAPGVTMPPDAPVGALPPEAVVLYTQANYQGTGVPVQNGKFGNQAGTLPIPNDSLESIKIPAGRKVTLYENDFGGFQFDATQSIPSLSTNSTMRTNGTWGKSVSSLFVANA